MTTTKRPQGRRPAGSGDLAAEILAAARQLYLEGDEDFAVTTVARLAGVDESTVRYHFNSRAELAAKVRKSFQLDPLLVELVGADAAAMSLSLWRQLGTDKVHVADAIYDSQDTRGFPIYKLTLRMADGDIHMRAAWTGTDLIPPIRRDQE